MSGVITPNGNICLTFEDSVSEKLAKFARKYFSDWADGYLIGEDSTPHLTLCQIHHDKPQPRALRRDLGAIKVGPETLNLDTLAQRASGTHFWMEFALNPTPDWLTDVKNQVEEILRKYEITSLTPALDWAPHITIARIKAASAKSLGTDALKFKTTIDPGQFNLSVGGSDANGQMPKVYWKQKLA